jgi:hypothetical protein
MRGAGIPAKIDCPWWKDAKPAALDHAELQLGAVWFVVGRLTVRSCGGIGSPWACPAMKAVTAVVVGVGRRSLKDKLAPHKPDRLTADACD